MVLADIVLVGSAPTGKALRRSGGRVGDVLYCTGRWGVRRRSWRGCWRTADEAGVGQEPRGSSADVSGASAGGGAGFAAAGAGYGLHRHERWAVDRSGAPLRGVGRACGGAVGRRCRCMLWRRA